MDIQVAGIGGDYFTPDYTDIAMIMWLNESGYKPLTPWYKLIKALIEAGF